MSAPPTPVLGPLQVAITPLWSTATAGGCRPNWFSRDVEDVAAFLATNTDKATIARFW